LDCPDCEGKRFGPDALAITWNGLNVADVLALTVSEARDVFRSYQDIYGPLQALVDVGLGYLRMGQRLTTLSGGESQRLKLAQHLADVRKQSGLGRGLFLLDEPTTGLHPDDISNLLESLDQLVEEGHTVVVVEHNLDVMKAADCIIDLGPEGGDGGGTVVAWGTPEKVARVKKSHTGRFLKALLKDVPRPQGDGTKSLLALVENSETHIEITAANEHNLKNLDVRIPRDKFVVVTGPSGSGKSTLAFDIVHSEGQRRYLESLSAFARQFVGDFSRPDVQSVTGLPPTIAIEQRTTRGAVNSTVATMTEVYHFLRLLYARVGRQYCPGCGVPIQARSVSELVADVGEQFKGETLSFFAPVIRGRKGFHKDVFARAARLGVDVALIDGEITHFKNDTLPELSRYQEHDISLLMEAGVEAEDVGSVSDAVRRALTWSGGDVAVFPNSKDKPKLLSLNNNCPSCELAFEPPDPRLFSFNSKRGGCVECGGKSTVAAFDLGLVAPEINQSLEDIELAIYKLRGLKKVVSKAAVLEEALDAKIPTKKPLSDFTEKQWDAFWFGNKKFEGLIPWLDRVYETTERDALIKQLDTLRVSSTCQAC
jgi:excinuclease ABC subunit A